MKQLIVILLSFVILSVTAKDFMIYACFKIKQVEIAQTLCVNRSTPKSNCNGKCFLMQKLKKSQEQQEQSPIANPDDCPVLWHIEETIEYFPPNFTRLESTLIPTEDCFLSKPYLLEVFQPPEWNI